MLILAAEGGIPWELIGPVGAAMVIGFYGQYQFGTKPLRNDLTAEKIERAKLQEQLNDLHGKRLEDAKVNIPVLDRLVKYLDTTEKPRGR
ncbi:MAG: hypothetical protein ACRD8W_00445 [Nitrososphaeraceae archaeon]